LASLIECPRCQHMLTLPDDFAGQRVACPKCSHDFAAMATLIPAMEMDAKPQPAPAKMDLPPPATTAYMPTTNGRDRSPSYLDGPTVCCPECGTDYSRGDDSCPRCGYRNYELLAERLGDRPRVRARQIAPVYGVFPVLAAFFLPLSAFVMFFGMVISEGLNPRRPPFVVGMFLFIAGSGLALVSLVFCLVWLYQAWRAVLERDEEYSPGLMVGLLAVPFFNLYWIFRAIPGLSSALQRELELVAPNRPTNAGRTVGLVACIFMVIPNFQPIAICILIAWMLLANNAVHRLARIHERLREEEDAAEAGRNNGRAESRGV
jgi:DNA-directed RNA polymerase subunit M/transcription elongation factor TFIIS